MSAALVALACGVIAWRALYAGDPEPPFPSLMVAVLALSGGRLSRAWALLVLGQAALAVGDVFYSAASPASTGPTTCDDPGRRMSPVIDPPRGSLSRGAAQT